MAGLSWLSTAISALPLITDLVKSSKELLKNRKINHTAPIDNVIDGDDSLTRIATACANNTESIRLITEQMKAQLEHFQSNAVSLQKRLRRLTFILFITTLIALFALIKAFNL